MNTTSNYSSDIVTLCFESIHEARALLSAIGSAKFGNVPPYDMDLMSSTLLARAASEISQMVRQYDKTRWGDVAEQNWEAWYWLNPERREWEVALNYGSLVCRDEWQEAPSDWRVQFVSVLVSPFGLTEEMQRRFIVELDELNRRGLARVNFTTG